MPPFNRSHGRPALQTLRSTALGLASFACRVVTSCVKINGCYAYNVSPCLDALFCLVLQTFKQIKSVLGRFLRIGLFKKYWGGGGGFKKIYFPKISLPVISVGQKKLEFSQPRNILDQNIPRDKSRNVLDENNIWGYEAKPGQAFPPPLSICDPFLRFIMCSTRCLYPCPLLELLMMLGTGTRYIVPGSTRVTHRP